MASRTSEGIEQHKNELSIAQKEGDKVKEAKAYCSLGVAYSNLGDFDVALNFFQKDLAIAKEIGDRSREAMVYFNLGDVNDSLENLEEAIECYERCVAIAKEVGDKHREGPAYSNLANIFEGLGDIEQAIEYHKKDLDISKAISDKAGEGRACSNLGNTLYSVGRFQDAIEYHKRDLAIALEEGDKSGEAIACCNLGVAFKNIGNFVEALEYHKRDLAIAEDLDDNTGKERAYCNIGIVFKSIGDFHQAIDYHEKHLVIAKAVGDKAGEGRAYGNLGNAYNCLGNYQQAIEYHRKDLSIATDLGNIAGEARAIGNIGNAYEGLGKFEQAIEHHKRQLAVALQRGDRAGEGRTYNNLGNAYDRLGDFREAINYHQKALEIAKELGNVTAEGKSYCGLGNAYDGLDEFQDAVEYHKKSLSIAKDLGDKDGEKRAYCNLGIVYRSLGELQKAIDCHNRNLAICRELGDKDAESKAYCALGNAYSDRNDFQEAMACFQSSLKVLDDMRGDLQPEDVWKTPFHELYHSANSALWGSLLRVKEYDKALCVAEQGRVQDLVDGSRIQYGLKILPPSHGPAETISILSQDGDSLAQVVFVDYLQTKINFWIIGKEEKIVFRQWNVEDGGKGQDPVADMVESVLEKIGACGRVQCENCSLDKPPDNDDDGNGDEAGDDDSGNYSTEALQPLFDALISPILDACESEELVIASDGFFSMIPFSVLRDSPRIRIVPSLTVMKMLRERLNEFHCENRVLLIGDPCLKNVTTDHGQPMFNQLLCARKEVEMIGEIHNVSPLTGAEATPQEVLKRIPNAALVHIATYARNETGEIVLAPNPVMAAKVPQKDDYMLKVSDLQDAGLRAKLVVLSCGDSGCGDLDMENVVGLAQALLVAGARSVLVTLWAVTDDANMEFMKAFHQHLADAKSASVALQLARKSLRDSEKFCAVKHWAPFVLVGDDVKLDFEQKESLHGEKNSMLICPSLEIVCFIQEIRSKALYITVRRSSLRKFSHSAV